MVFSPYRLFNSSLTGHTSHRMVRLALYLAIAPLFQYAYLHKGTNKPSVLEIVFALLSDLGQYVAVP